MLRPLTDTSWTLAILTLVVIVLPLTVKLWHPALVPLDAPAFAVVDIPGKGKGLMARRDFRVCPCYYFVLDLLLLTDSL